MFPLRITIRDIPNSAALEKHIHKRAEKLEQFYQHIISCSVVVSLSQKHKHQGKLFTTRIDLIKHGKEFAVTHKMNEDVYITVRDAFDALERQLESAAKRKRSEVRRRVKNTRYLEENSVIE